LKRSQGIARKNFKWCTGGAWRSGAS